MSFSMNKLKSFLPGNKNNSSSSSNDNRRHTLLLEPEIGFQLSVTSLNNTNKSYENDKNVPELNVNLIAARHLPSTFGFKSVQGYVVKVKLFPGSLKFDSNIQTSTWPKYDENFKFSLQPEIKSSIKNYSKDKYFDVNIPEKLFSGHFVVFTMYALLELPPSFNRFRGTYRSLRDKSHSLIQKISEQNNENTNTKKDEENKSREKIKDIENESHLTKSETKRNLGSVTCYLEPKLFKKNMKTEQYETEEIWLPIKDLTITNTPDTSNRVTSSTKGQLELILEFCDEVDDSKDDTKLDTSTNPKNLKQSWKSHYTELKRKIKTGKSEGSNKVQYIKVTTSKMRTSIKVKEEFEQTAGEIYIKTSIFENNILIDSWKCDNFLPSISSRWDPKLSTIILPLVDDKNLSNIIIKSTVATKNKIGKKIIFGTILINAEATKQSSDHWQRMIGSKNEPISMWHNFQ